jgi:hypothetical protein
MRARLAIVMSTALTVAAVAGGAGASPPTAAAAPPPSTGSGGLTSSQDQGQRAPAAAPKTYKSYLIKGGYVAAGVSLRNRGSGTINVGGIPAGAKVKSAYLYWSVLGAAKEGSSYKKGKFAGANITGTKIGSGDTPCWPGTAKGYAYRSDVTKKVKKNGSFKLKSFASSVHDGRDPFTTTSKAPLAEGASLVVVYTKSTYPLTRVVIANGYSMVSSSPGATVTMPFGFAATNPVGEVKTTFIGGDGQSNGDEPASRVNGVPVPGADWDGTDGPLPRYSAGNLWDTDTVALPNVVKPGDTSAKVQVNGGPDCLGWVAQVLSIGRNGNLDTDGDKLKDGWEANGYDANHDGVVDVNLPGMGASVVQKDLFVEMDYMTTHLPQTADLDRIVKVFATAPQAKNPNGKTGIRLHLDAGAARGAKYNLGGGNQVPFDADLNPVVPQFNAIKSGNFNSRRAGIFYYMIWANGYDGGSSSGNAFNIPNDSFVVTLGLWPGGGSPDEKVGTFIHEFGHALGQKHGGSNHDNYKPNYLSVMNYAFQTGGVLRTGNTPPYFGYSAVDLPSLNENSLNEKKGLRSSAAKTYRTRWICPAGFLKTSATRSDKNLDWNCNGSLQSNVSADINGDGLKNTLDSWNNWGNLVYGGGAVGGGQSASSILPRELTFEEHQQMRR